MLTQVTKSEAFAWAHTTLVMYLSSEDVLSLTAEDVSILRDLGLTESMYHQLRALSTQPGLCIRCDFNAGTVVVADSATGEPLR